MYENKCGKQFLDSTKIVVKSFQPASIAAAARSKWPPSANENVQRAVSIVNIVIPNLIDNRPLAPKCA